MWNTSKIWSTSAHWLLNKNTHFQPSLLIWVKLDHILWINCFLAVPSMPPGWSAWTLTGSVMCRVSWWKTARLVTAHCNKCKNVNYWFDYMNFYNSRTLPTLCFGNDFVETLSRVLLKPNYTSCILLDMQFHLNGKTDVDVSETH